MAARATRKRPRIGTDVVALPPNQVPIDREAATRSGTGGDRTRERDSEFWFEDGNVILVTHDIEFLVYKGILADASPVFKDMFPLPYPGDPASPLSDSPFPEIFLDDSPQDLRHILRVLMPKTALHRFVKYQRRTPLWLHRPLTEIHSRTPPPHPDRPTSPFMPPNPSFDMISATIRLGLKYELSALVAHSLAYLEQRFPSSFDAWMKAPAPSPSSPAGKFKFEAHHAIGVVNLARLTGEHTLLPTALLMCCLLGGRVVEGFVREDGSCEALSMEDVALCFEAKGALISVCVASAVRVFQPVVSPQCKYREALQAGTGGRTQDENVAGRPPNTIASLGKAGKCRRELERMLHGLDAIAHRFAIPDPLSSHLRWYGKDVRKALCRPCYAMVKNRDRLERRAVWQRLPELLGIEVQGWGDSAAGGGGMGEQLRCGAGH